MKQNAKKLSPIPMTLDVSWNYVCVVFVVVIFLPSFLFNMNRSVKYMSFMIGNSQEGGQICDPPINLGP